MIESNKGMNENMITKEAQIDYLQWVMTYCKQFTFDTIIVKDEKIKKYLENHDIDKLPYDLIYQINANNVIFYRLNSEIYNISVSDDKEKILGSVKKYELKDK